MCGLKPRAAWVACFSADLILIVAHVLLDAGVLQDQGFALTRDRGYSEYFQYAKEATITVGLASIALRRSSWSLWILAAFFGYVLIDDALMIHERVGMSLANAGEWPGFLALRPQDIAELVVLSAVGCLSVAIVAATWRVTDPVDRRLTRQVIAGIFALAIFGVLTDMLHALARATTGLRFLLGTVEEGGEMLTMTLVMGLVWSRAARRD